jgi:hypothetical protein
MAQLECNRAGPNGERHWIVLRAGVPRRHVRSRWNPSGCVQRPPGCRARRWPGGHCQAGPNPRTGSFGSPGHHQVRPTCGGHSSEMGCSHCFTPAHLGSCVSVGAGGPPPAWHRESGTPPSRRQVEANSQPGPLRSTSCDIQRCTRLLFHRPLGSCSSRPA